MDLLYRIPIGVIRVYGRMLTRLQAQESMRMAERLGVGTGAIKSRDAKAIKRGWRRDALGTTRETHVLPPQQLGSIGIKFVKVSALRA